MSVPESAIDRLLEEGQEIPDDPLEIEKLLLEQGMKPDTDDEPETPEPESDKAEKPKQADEVEPDDDASPKGPPAALLRTYRESLHERDEQLKARDDELESKNTEIEKLQGRLAQALNRDEQSRQDLQDKVDEVTEDERIEDLTPERIAVIREEAGDEVADQLEAYAKQYTVLDSRLKELEEANDALKTQREATENQAVLNDLDTVPLLSVLAAARGEDADARWARAIQYEKVIKADPDWSDKSRREVYQEVGRRMQQHLGADVVKSLVGDKAAIPADTGKQQDTSHDKAVKEAMQRADNSAIPTSLSDLPAGEAAPQSEFERAQGMSVADIETAIEKAFEKGGPEAVDEVLNKFMTVDSP